MKQETIEKARVTKLRNSLSYEVMTDWRWNYRGTEFCRYDIVGLRAANRFGCWLFCNTKRVRVRLEGAEEYNLQAQEATFTGENAWGDCIDWIVNRVIEMDYTIEERRQKANQYAIEYFKKLKGE